ncbi:MAG: hypothetical protein CAK90_00955 [Spartobacteria bacterium AMD-G4]|nr:MAG: hypothetical protein CAK90_00955 [Spartobacteria bacterium AMD-G4]
MTGTAGETGSFLDKINKIDKIEGRGKAEGRAGYRKLEIRDLAQKDGESLAKSWTAKSLGEN